MYHKRRKVYNIGRTGFRILGAKGGEPNFQHANDVILISMRRNNVASTSFRRHVPTRFLINQCQIIVPNRSSTIQDKSGKCLTEEKEILSRWTEYCSELYNYESCLDNAVLDCSQPPEEYLQPILREEVEIAVASLKKGKSAGVNNIPAELVQACGETMTDVLTEICNRIWRTGEWPTPWTQSLIITLPKKGNLQLCQNYRTISLISHSSEVMLKVVLKRLNPQAEEIIAEEQAGFRAAGRSTTEQIFYLRILCEKYLQRQQNL